MATILKAGNVASGAQITSDATGSLEIKTGTGSGTTAITVGTDQAVSIGGNNISAVNSLGFRNRIINGDMRIDQRNAGASVTPANSQYLVDRFWYNSTQTSKVTAQQSSVAPPGFTNSQLITSSSAYSVGTNDVFGVSQIIEGYNIADFGFGAAGAATITLSFWVRSSLTGTFGGSLYNSGATRCYPFSYTINSANTWEQKTVTIAGDTTGTWLTNNGIGITVYFCLGTGSTYGGTANAWTGSTKLGVTGQVSLVGTNGATFYITGVQLEAGSVATPFERRDYGRELMMAQRYFQKYTQPPLRGVVDASSNAGRMAMVLPVVMRATPTSTVGALPIYEGTNTTTVSSVAADYSTAFAVEYAFACAISLTNHGRACLVYQSGTSSLSLSAEL